MKIIAIDSSGLVASVAIVEDEEVIAEYNVQYKKTHSQTLLPMLDELKRMVDLDLQSVDAIAIASGPGSFTGLRIGSATAKGLGLALEIPIIEIPTLDGLACNLYGTDKVVCPIMDARRNQVAEKCNEQQKEIIFLGDGVPVFAEQLKNLMKVPYSFAPAHMNRQRAASFAFLAFEKLRKGEVVPAADHAPEYLRLSQAEREKAAKREKQ